MLFLGGGVCLLRPLFGVSLLTNRFCIVSTFEFANGVLLSLPILNFLFLYQTQNLVWSSQVTYLIWFSFWLCLFFGSQSILARADLGPDKLKLVGGGWANFVPVGLLVNGAWTKTLVDPVGHPIFIWGNISHPCKIKFRLVRWHKSPLFLAILRKNISSFFLLKLSIRVLKFSTLLGNLGLPKLIYALQMAWLLDKLAKPAVATRIHQILGIAVLVFVAKMMRHLKWLLLLLHVTWL